MADTWIERNTCGECSKLLSAIGTCKDHLGANWGDRFRDVERDPRGLSPWEQQLMKDRDAHTQQLVMFLEQEFDERLTKLFADMAQNLRITFTTGAAPEDQIRAAIFKLVHERDAVIAATGFTPAASIDVAAVVRADYQNTQRLMADLIRVVNGRTPTIGISPEAIAIKIAQYNDAMSQMSDNMVGRALRLAYLRIVKDLTDLVADVEEQRRRAAVERQTLDEAQRHTLPRPAAVNGDKPGTDASATV